MRELSKSKTFFWISVIVAAELAAFNLLQKSVDNEKNASLYIFLSILLFAIVPIAFRETLKGNKIAIANLYWIIASCVGSIILGYWVFKQSITKKEYVAVGLVIISALVLNS